MAFPADPLPLTVELDLVGDWSAPTDITSYVYGRDPVTITRGRTAEGSTVDPSTLTLTLNNRDGRFSPRNPTGPYYGTLGRNTPIRASVTLGKTRFASLQGATGGVWFTGDSAQQDIVGDIDLRIETHQRSWRVSSGLIYKYADPSQRSYFLQLNADGTLTLFWSSTGSNLLSATSTQAVPFTTGRYTVRATLDVDNGASGNTTTFYTGTGGVSGTFTQLGAAVTQAGTTSIFNSTSGVAVDAGAGLASNGNAVYAAQIRSGIAGTIKANPDFTAQTNGATSFTDSASALWTGSFASVTSKRIRFVGEVPAWPVKWDTSGQDVYVEIAAAGTLRRLSQGPSPLWDSMRRLAVNNGALQYWPMSDPASAIDAVSAAGGPKLAFTTFNTTGVTTGRPNFGDGSLYPHLPPAMATARAEVGALSGGELVARWTTGTDSTKFAFDVLYRATEGANDNDLPMNTEFYIFTTTGIRWHWRPTTNFTQIEVAAYTANETFIGDNDFSAGDLYGGQTHHVRLEVSSVNSTTQQYVLYLDGTQLSTASIVTSVDIGHPRASVLTYFADDVQSQINPVHVGQLIVWNGPDYPAVGDAVDASLGYSGETAGARLARLAGEEDLDLVVFGDPGDTVDMGPQRAATLIELLQECAATDQGLLYEPRDRGGLAYLTRVGLQNQQVGLALDYASADLSAFEPAEDDSALRNDVTLTDTLGAAYQATLDTGTLSTAAPPAGVGRYQESLQVNPETADQLPDLAGWRLHLGTVDEARYPVISVGLHRSNYAVAALTTSVLDQDLGGVLAVTSPPAWLPPDDVLQLVQGSRETLSNFTYDVELNCAPASPWTVGVYEDTAFRYHSDGSTLSAGVTSSATSLSVATASGPLWGHGDGDFDMVIGGERMTVTAISGASSPQTFTVTRSVNGVSKAHSAGDTVDLFQPSIYAI